MSSLPQVNSRANFYKVLMACSYCICHAGIVNQASLQEVEPLVLFDIFSKSHSYGKLVCLAAVQGS